MLCFKKMISCMVFHIKWNILARESNESHYRQISVYYELTVNGNLVPWDRGGERGRGFIPYWQINHRKSLKVHNNFSARKTFLSALLSTSQYKVSSFLFCFMWFFLIFVCLYIKNSQVVNNSLHSCFKPPHRIPSLLYH